MKYKLLLAIMVLLATGSSPMTGRSAAEQTISITAERFSFEPNEITLKKGQQVTLEIRTKDVSHGLLIEDLGVRADIKKGQTNEVTFTPESVGTFEGKCAHFCGSGHGSMKMVVHVTE